MSLVFGAAQSQQCAMALCGWRGLPQDRGLGAGGNPGSSRCLWHSKGFRCSAATDNQGNSRVVARLLTTKFPLNAFLMELAAQLQCRGAELDLYWLPRLQNIEADELTNSICHRFAEGNRLRFQLAEFRGLVLGSMLEEGMSLYQDIATCRAAKKARQSSKLPKSQALHARDPWQ